MEKNYNFTPSNYDGDLPYHIFVTGCARKINFPSVYVEKGNDENSILRRKNINGIF